MPYIKQNSTDFESGRDDYDKLIDDLIYRLHWGDHWSPGDVNYVIYRLLLGWWKHEPRYKTICSIMGTLSCVAQEFYRKVASDYENKAIEKNGDVT